MFRENRANFPGTEFEETGVTRPTIQSFMKTLRSFLLLSCAFLAIAGARATTVIPPTFDELVNEAELIFQGAVTDVRSQWTGEGAERRIVSDITFQVEDALKGTPGESYTIRMLGGTVDGQTLRVSDAPTFKVGDRDILFVENNGRQFIPLVGIMHGRFHVQQEQDGKESIARDNGAPLSDLAKLGKDENAASAGKALSTTDFKAAIREKLSQAPAVK